MNTKKEDTIFNTRKQRKRIVQPMMITQALIPKDDVIFLNVEMEISHKQSNQSIYIYIKDSSKVIHLQKRG